jgi:hypothetical protein
LTHLHKVNIRKRLDGLSTLGRRKGVEESALGLLGESLEGHLLGTTTDGGLGCLVRLHTSDDLGLASGGLNVGAGDVKLLLDDPAVDLFVNGDTNGSLVHVEHDTGSTVVVLERHTLVDGGIHFDVDIVTSLELPQLDSGLDRTIGLVRLLEKSTGLSTITETVRHFLL